MVQELALRRVEHDVYACGGRVCVLQILDYKEKVLEVCTEVIVIGVST